MIKVAFTTLGCKVNWADTEFLRQSCQLAGFEIVSFESAAEAYVINTCAVTQIADRQSRQMVRRAKARNPNATIIAVGCSCEIARSSFGEMKEVDAVFGTSDRNDAVGYLLKRFCAKSHLGGAVSSGQSRARAFLKIQDGCDRGCAYCIVPSARGRSVSVAFDDVIKKARELSHHHREIILTGVDIGQYNSKGRNLEDLVDVLTSDNSVSRVRITSIDPSLMSERMLSFFSRKDRLCRHVHLSMQSLSDKIIERMGRSYRSREVELLIKKLGSLVPGIAITGDLIAGFPGESDSDHLFTASLLKKLPMAGLHVFPFSARKGTRACSMEGFLDSRVIKARAFELRDIAKKLRGRYLESQKGMVVDAIVTSDEGDIKKEVEAFSDNAISISLPKGTVKYGAMAPVRIDFVSEKKVRGTWC